MTRDHDRMAVAAWCGLYALAATTWYALWQARFAERSADEAIFENLLWNATHGNGLTTFIEGAGIPHLAVHFSPVLYLLCPFYAVFHSMIVVHALVAAGVAAAGYGVHRYATRTAGEQPAHWLTLAFLLHPTIVLQTFMEFHEQALAILPLTLLLIAWLEDRRLPTVLWALALLTIREDNALPVIVLGLMALTQRGRRRVGLALVLLGAADIGAWRMFAGGALGGSRLPPVFAGTYSMWGETPGEVLRGLSSQPVRVLQHLLSPYPVRYLATLLVPFLLVLPFRSPLVWAMVPQLMMVLLATPGSRVYEARMHFSIVPVIVLFFASMSTVVPARATAGARSRWLRRWVPVGMLSVVVLAAPVWMGRAARRLSPFAPEIRRVLATIPDTASVTAPGYLLNHLAGRPRIALAWNDDILHTEYVILEDSSRFFFKGRTVDVFYSPRLDSLLAHARYSRALEYRGWHVYRRTPSTSR